MAEPNPYVGPRPFEEIEERFFFGRTKEIEILTSLAIARRASLLFAQSGVGKSSLLRAGLTPRLLRHKRMVRGRAVIEPLVSDIRIASVGRGREDEQPENIFIQSALLSLQPPTTNSYNSTLSDALSSWLMPRPQTDSSDEAPLPFLLVFDQFEELFTRHAKFRQHREKFFRQVSEALAAHDSLRVLFSMREDYIAELTPYSPLLPEQLRPRFRLERLKGSAALEAITSPAVRAHKPRPFAEGVAEELQSHLLAGGGEDIEPILLQVVCKRLWQNLPEERTAIVSDDVQQYGDVERALIDYYNSTVDTVVREVKASGGSISQRRVRRFFNESLLTPAHTRALVYRDDANGFTAGLPNAAIDVLSRSDINIVRGEARGQSHWYELSHDRLIPPVLTANEEWTRSNSTPLQNRFQNWTSRGQLDRDLLNALEVRDIEAWKRNNPDDPLTTPEEDFLQRSRQRHRSKRLYQALAMSIVVIVFSAVFYNYYTAWVDLRPWGALVNLSDGHVYKLSGDSVLVGRATERFKPSISLRPNLISRTHLLIDPKLNAIDVRTMNGTTVNGRFLMYGEGQRLTEGDVLVLASIAPFKLSVFRYDWWQLWEPKPVIPDIPEIAKALLIDGPSKSVQYLGVGTYYLGLNEQDEIIVSEAKTPQSRLILQWQPQFQSFAMEDLDDGRHLGAMIKLGETYAYTQCLIPPAVRFMDIPVKMLHERSRCQDINWRTDYDETMRWEQPLENLIFYLDGEHSFRLIPKIEKLAQTD